MKGKKRKCRATPLGSIHEHISGEQKEVFNPLDGDLMFKPSTKYKCTICNHSVGIYARFYSDGSFKEWMVKTHYYIRKSI